MESLSYSDIVRSAYEGELLGEMTYRRFARLCEDADNRVKLSAVADLEERTHRTLQPLAVRLGIQPATERLEARAQERARDLARLSWPAFLDKARSDWPPYITRFAMLAARAEPGDELALAFLVDHEKALVEFIDLEHRGAPASVSLAPIRALLDPPQGQASSR
jgi:hypothetical protein